MIRILQIGELPHKGLQKGNKMKPPGNIDAGPTVLIVRNTLWAFPYLAVMGLIWGYLANASSGAIAGLVVSAAASILIGRATTYFSETPGGRAVNAPDIPERKTAGLREQSAGDLNVVRYHRLCHRFDFALIKIEEVLTRDPDFAEALLLKAQILWEGFGDAHTARESLLKIIAVEPDEKAVLHRWALNFYEMLNKELK